MKFRTLDELCHHEQAVTLVEPQAQSEHSPHLRGTDIVLVPHPSNDVNDPLRFPVWKKYIIFSNTICLTFVCNFWLGGLAPAFYILGKEFQINTSQSTGLITFPLLAAGLCVCKHCLPFQGQIGYGEHIRSSDSDLTDSCRTSFGYPPPTTWADGLCLWSVLS